MADERKRRRSSSQNNDFDWDAYDMQSSQRNTRRSSSDIARRSEADAYSNAPRRKRKKKKEKKQFTEAQLTRRRIFRNAALAVCLVGIVALTGITIGMYFAVS